MLFLRALFLPHVLFFLFLQFLADEWYWVLGSPFSPPLINVLNMVLWITGTVFVWVVLARIPCCCCFTCSFCYTKRSISWGSSSSGGGRGAEEPPSPSLAGAPVRAAEAGTNSGGTREKISGVQTLEQPDGGNKSTIENHTEQQEAVPEGFPPPLYVCSCFQIRSCADCDAQTSDCCCNRYVFEPLYASILPQSTAAISNKLLRGRGKDAPSPHNLPNFAETGDPRDHGRVLLLAFCVPIWLLLISLTGVKTIAVVGLGFLKVLFWFCLMTPSPSPSSSLAAFLPARGALVSLSAMEKFLHHTPATVMLLSALKVANGGRNLVHSPLLLFLALSVLAGGTVLAAFGVGSPSRGVNLERDEHESAGKGKKSASGSSRDNFSFPESGAEREQTTVFVLRETGISLLLTSQVLLILFLSNPLFSARNAGLTVDNAETFVEFDNFLRRFYLVSFGVVLLATGTWSVRGGRSLCCTKPRILVTTVAQVVIAALIGTVGGQSALGSDTTDPSEVSSQQEVLVFALLAATMFRIGMFSISLPEKSAVSKSNHGSHDWTWRRRTFQESIRSFVFFRTVVFQYGIVSVCLTQNYSFLLTQTCLGAVAWAMLLVAAKRSDELADLPAPVFPPSTKDEAVQPPPGVVGARNATQEHAAEDRRNLAEEGDQILGPVVLVEQERRAPGSDRPVGADDRAAEHEPLPSPVSPPFLHAVFSAIIALACVFGTLAALRGHENCSGAKTSSQTPQNKNATLRFVSWNVQRGYKGQDWWTVNTMADLRSALSEWSPDVVGFQEGEMQHFLLGSADLGFNFRWQEAFSASSGQLRFCSFFYGNSVVHNGFFGNPIFSRTRSLENCRVHQLWPSSHANTLPFLYSQCEVRVERASTVDGVSSKKVVLFNVHGPLLQDDKEANWAQIVRAIREERRGGHAVVLLGDLNTPNRPVPERDRPNNLIGLTTAENQGGAGMVHVLNPFGDAGYEQPDTRVTAAGWPRLDIDHMFVVGHKRVKKAWVHNEGNWMGAISDHLAIVADIEF